jgi:hypothetical protein
MLHELGVSGIEMRALWGRSGGAVMVPQLLFYLGLRQGTLAGAVVVAGGWTTALLVYELLRRRILDPMVLYGLMFTVLQGVIALVAQSPALYAGGGAVENLLDGLGLLGSIAVCRPLLVILVGSAIRGRAVLTLPMRAALERLTLLWGLALLARSTGSTRRSPICRWVRWPLNGVGVLLSLAYVRVQLHRAPQVRHATARCATRLGWRSTASR